MQEVEVTLQTLLAFFGGLTCIVGGLSAAAKLFKPFKNLQDQVEVHADMLKDGCVNFNDLEEAVKKNEEADRIIMQSLLVLLNHEITGNGVDKLKEQRAAIEEYLIAK